ARRDHPHPAEIAERVPRGAPGPPRDRRQHAVRAAGVQFPDREDEPGEAGAGTFPLSEAATDRFAIMVNIGYLPPEEEAKLVHFDFKKVRLNPLMTKERIIQLRSVISEQVFLHERLGTYIQRLVAATRPYNPDTDWLVR